MITSGKANACHPDGVINGDIYKVTKVTNMINWQKTLSTIAHAKLSCGSAAMEVLSFLLFKIST